MDLVAKAIGKEIRLLNMYGTYGYFGKKTFWDNSTNTSLSSGRNVMLEGYLSLTFNQI